MAHGNAYDAIVIGVGGMGSSTVYQFARRGLRVLGLEQFSIPHDFGSSHGVSRMIRMAYFENPNYVPLLRRSYELWREMENLCRERLLIITGGLDCGEFANHSADCCRIHHLPFELLDAAEIHRRWPGVCFPKNMSAAYQPDAGFVLSERAIVNYVFAAQDLGAEIHACEPVIDWQPDGAGVKVRTKHAEYRAARLVLTAGPWASKLFPAIAQNAVAQRQVLLWAQPRKPELFRLGAFPVFALLGPYGHFYGFPVFEIPGFKIGKMFHRNEDSDPDQVDRVIHPEDEEVLREGIRTYFPDADGPTMAMKTCLFTNTPDKNFIIDLLPGLPQVAIAAGFSGHGFKFASVVGEIMADLVLHGKSRFDLDMFNIRRFS